MTAITKTSPVIFYRGFTIQHCDSYPYSMGRFILYPTEEGIDHDADFDGESYRYCGNCKWADSIEEAKDQIFEKIMMDTPAYKVETIIKLGGYRLRNITKFTWLSDAMTFAEKTNGYLDMSFLNPVNP